jgi:type I restriction enzyme S subunit
MEAIIEKPTLQRYPAYKDSGVEWLGEIPEHWEILPGLSFIFENKDRNKGMIRNTVLSLSYGKIRVKGENELTGLVPESFETYQFVNKGDLIFRPTDLQNDTVSLRSSISEYEGIITNAYLNLRFRPKANSKFYHYFFRSIDNNKIIYGLGSGLRQNISYLDFRRFQFPFPPRQEQNIIANFLDDKTTKIDQAIAIKQKQIELLKERRQILIHKAVTRGLNENVKLKDSGVEWIGEIPEHWDADKFKFFIKLRHGNQFRENDFTEEGIKIVKISQLHPDGYLDLSNASTISSNRLKSFEHITIKENDVLMCLTGGTIGKIIRAKNIKEPLLQNYRVGHFSSLNEKKLNEDYMFLLLSSKLIMNQILVDMSETGQPNIGMEDMKNMYLVIPKTINEQKKIVEFIENASTKIATAISLKEQEIDKLKEYKMSLIDGVVTGKIKVC